MTPRADSTASPSPPNDPPQPRTPIAPPPPTLRVGLELVATPAGLSRLLSDVGVTLQRESRDGYRLLSVAVMTPEAEPEDASLAPRGVAPSVAGDSLGKEVTRGR